jgi:hypothetical protein
MLLQALVACAGVTLGAVATALGIKLSGKRTPLFHQCITLYVRVIEVFDKHLADA